METKLAIVHVYAYVHVSLSVLTFALNAKCSNLSTTKATIEICHRRGKY